MVYANHKWQQIKQKTTGALVDLQLSIMKPLGAKWMIQLHDYLQSKPKLSTLKVHAFSAARELTTDHTAK